MLKQHPKKQGFLAALGKVKDSSEKKPPQSWAGLFYIIVGEAARDIFELSVAKFSEEQRTVAESEYLETGANWADQLRGDFNELKTAKEPEPMKMVEVTETSPEVEMFQTKFQFLNKELETIDPEKEIGIVLNALVERAIEQKNSSYEEATKTLEEAISKLPKK